MLTSETKETCYGICVIDDVLKVIWVCSFSSICQLGLSLSVLLCVFTRTHSFTHSLIYTHSLSHPHPLLFL
jgi:hypothetical protein